MIEKFWERLRVAEDDADIVHITQTKEEGRKHVMHDTDGRSKILSSCCIVLSVMMSKINGEPQRAIELVRENMFRYFSPTSIQVMTREGQSLVLSATIEPQ